MKNVKYLVLFTKMSFTYTIDYVKIIPNKGDYVVINNIRYKVSELTFDYVTETIEIALLKF